MRERLLLPSQTASAIDYAPAVTASDGGYYSSAVNPRFGYVPELGYSTAVDFKIYPRSD